MRLPIAFARPMQAIARDRLPSALVKAIARDQLPIAFTRAFPLAVDALPLVISRQPAVVSM